MPCFGHLNSTHIILTDKDQVVGPQLEFSSDVLKDGQTFSWTCRENSDRVSNTLQFKTTGDKFISYGKTVATHFVTSHATYVYNVCHTVRSSETDCLGVNKHLVEVLPDSGSWLGFVCVHGSLFCNTNLSPTEIAIITNMDRSHR